MNKLRTIQESPLGTFLVDAEHDGKKILALNVHPILEGKVGPSIVDGLENWQELTDKLENLLANPK